MPRGRGGGHYGPRPVLGVGGGALVVGGGGVGGAGVVGMDVGPPRVSKNYKDIDVPKVRMEGRRTERERGRRDTRLHGSCVSVCVTLIIYFRFCAKC